MSQSSAFQRFARELRRRHVPQTAAVYLVAAWAAIEFADVVVPNLDGPQWVVTAVIVAAAVGFPAVLILAWVFDWGPAGIHRTGPEEPEEGEADASSRASMPVLAAVAVLVVAIGSGLAVAALVAGGGGDDGAAPAREDVPRRPTAPGSHPGLAPPTAMDSLNELIRRQLSEVEGLRDLGRLGGLEALGGLAAMDSLDMGDFIDVATAMAEESDLNVLLRQPRQWRLDRRVPAPLSAGDTLIIDGVAVDSAGVAAVLVDGAIVAEADEPRDVLGFTARVVGTGRSGMRNVVVVVRTGDGRELRREYPVVQRPGGSP